LIATGFAIFGRILGTSVSASPGVTALAIASETAIFLFLALPLMFPKPVPAAAERIFRSAVTVEKHVSGIFRKFGISPKISDGGRAVFLAKVIHPEDRAEN
jgi:hypothetical protein